MNALNFVLLCLAIQPVLWAAFLIAGYISKPKLTSAERSAS